MGAMRAKKQNSRNLQTCTSRWRKMRRRGLKTTCQTSYKRIMPLWTSWYHKNALMQKTRDTGKDERGIGHWAKEENKQATQNVVKCSGQKQRQSATREHQAQGQGQGRKCHQQDARHNMVIQDRAFGEDYHRDPSPVAAPCATPLSPQEKNGLHQIIWLVSTTRCTAANAMDPFHLLAPTSFARIERAPQSGIASIAMAKGLPEISGREHKWQPHEVGDE